MRVTREADDRPQHYPMEANDDKRAVRASQRANICLLPGRLRDPERAQALAARILDPHVPAVEVRPIHDTIDLGQ